MTTTSFFDLPRKIRDQIYVISLYGRNPRQSLHQPSINYPYHQVTLGYLIKSNMALLRSYRRVYEECMMCLPPTDMYIERPTRYYLLEEGGQEGSWLGRIYCEFINGRRIWLRNYKVLNEWFSNLGLHSRSRLSRTQFVIHHNSFCDQYNSDEELLSEVIEFIALRTTTQHFAIIIAGSRQASIFRALFHPDSIVAKSLAQLRRLRYFSVKCVKKDQVFCGSQPSDYGFWGKIDWNESNKAMELGKRNLKRIWGLVVSENA